MNQSLIRLVESFVGSESTVHKIVDEVSFLLKVRSRGKDAVANGERTPEDQGFAAIAAANLCMEESRTIFEWLEAQWQDVERSSL